MRNTQNNPQPRHVLVNQAYAEIVSKFLELKACGYDVDVLTDAAARAAYQAGINLK